MPTKVILVVDSIEPGKNQQSLMVKAMTKAIADYPHAAIPPEVFTFTPEIEPIQAKDAIYCHLTLNIPQPLSPLFQACSDVSQLRKTVQENWGENVNVGEGEFYLPVVLTAKGALYGEVIGTNLAGMYEQPISLPDANRQPLYAFAHSLLDFLSAAPAVYMVQFGWENEQLVFDRLYPFPNESAIASLNIQEPNLFECHWCCLTHQPIFDLIIRPQNIRKTESVTGSQSPKI